MADPSATNGGAVSDCSGSISSSLLERVKAHDHEAWDRLVQVYSPLVYSWCRRSHVGPEDARDAVQEVFRAVYVGVAGFRRDRPSDTFRGWLWTITRNRVRDHFRARRGEPQAAGGTDAQQQLLELPDSEPEAESDSTSTSRSSSLFFQAMEPVRAEFETRTWDAFWRAAVEGDSTDDIAASLGMSLNAVRIAKSRVLRRLREEFRDLIA